MTRGLTKLAIGRIKKLTLTALIVAALSYLTFRNLFLFLYLPLVLCLTYFFGQKIKISDLGFLLLFSFFGWISALIEGIHWPNYLFSLYLLIPTFIIVRSVWSPSYVSDGDNLDHFMRVSGIILFIVNISAFIFYLHSSVSFGVNLDDEFTGFYGKSGLGSHSLSIINLIYAYYNICYKRIGLFFFFLISGIMGFFGLGLILFFLALIWVYSSRVLKYYKQIIAGALGLAIIFGVITVVNDKNLKYLNNNIIQGIESVQNYDYKEELAISNEMKVSKAPRFITFLAVSVNTLKSDPKVFWLGTSPGGYNSRVAFMFNGDFMQSDFLTSMFRYQTKYHSENVFVLQNRALLELPFNDGTRNQPFSSIISLLLEYGVILGGGFLFLIFSRIRSIVNKQKSFKKLFLEFLFIYLFLILFFQNFLEYPEVIVPIVFMFKMSDLDSRAEPAVSTES